MRITTLYLDDTASVSRMAAPVPDRQPLTLAAQQPAPNTAEAAWEAWEAATFPTLTR